MIDLDHCPSCGVRKYVPTKVPSTFNPSVIITVAMPTGIPHGIGCTYRLPAASAASLDGRRPCLSCGVRFDRRGYASHARKCERSRAAVSR